MRFKLLRTLCIVLAVIADACAQTASVQTNRTSETPHLAGRMVNLGGYQLHLYCVGEGKPTVILSAGAGDLSTDWALVQSKVADFTRVCSYDRSGAAWSDLGPKPRTLDQEAFDLYRLITAAGEHAPYIVVGQSLGGMVVRIFAEQHPKDVAGIVLVDSYSEDAQLFTNGGLHRMRLLAKDRPIPPPRSSLSKADELTTTELQHIREFMKQMGTPPITAPYDRLPEYSQQVRLWALQQPKYWAQDDDYLPEISARMYAESQDTEHPLGDIPLVVLTRDEYDYPGPDATSLITEHKEQQNRMAKLSSRGHQNIVAHSGHEIHLYQPDAVVGAIRQVMTKHPVPRDGR